MQPRQRFLDRHIHLCRADDWLQHLLLQRRNPAVPEERLAIASIHNGRNTPLSAPSGHALGDGFPICECAFRIVAGGARDGLVPRKPAVGEQVPSHCHLFPSERIRFRNRQEGIESKRDVESLVARYGESYKQEREHDSGQIHQTVLS